MKKLWMATTVALVAVTIALLTMAYKPGTNEPKQILTVRVNYSASYPNIAGIYISYPDGRTSFEAVQKLIRPKKNTDFEENFSLILKTLNKITSEGYTLINTSYNRSLEVYVFEK